MEKNYDFRKRLLQIHEKDVRNNNRTVTENEYEIEEVIDEEGEKTINEIPHRLYVDVCDWELKPIVRYDLDKVSARECMVDIYNKKIYAWNSDLDFENVYIYSYN